MVTSYYHYSPVTVLPKGRLLPHCAAHLIILTLVFCCVKGIIDVFYKKARALSSVNLKWVTNLSTISSALQISFKSDTVVRIVSSLPSSLYLLLVIICHNIQQVRKAVFVSSSLSSPQVLASSYQPL